MNFRFFPVYQSTFVLPMPREEAMYLLQISTKSPHPDSDDFFKEIKISGLQTFQGHIEEDSFRLFKISKHHEFFAPLVAGHFEKTNQGCLVFSRYKAHRQTRLLVQWITALCFVLIMIMSLSEEHKYIAAAYTLLFWIGSYSIALINFRQQVKRTQEAFKQIFEI